MICGFKEQTIQNILTVLSEQEMHGSEFLIILKKRGVYIPEGDGFLFPLLYLLEREKLLSSYRTTTKSGKKRRFYKITPFGLIYLKKVVAKKTIYSVSQFDTSSVPCPSLEAIVCHLHGRAKKRFLQEYQDLFEDMGTIALGDTILLAQRFAEIVNTTSKKFFTRSNLIAISIILGITGVLFLLYLAWGIFVPQCIGIVLLIYIAFHFINSCRILMKRTSAIRKIIKTAKENGYSVSKKENAFLSVFRHAPLPSLLLEKKGIIYKIRFATTWRRAQILKFRSPFIYQPVNVRGLAIGVTHRLFHIGAFFRPKGMDGGLFQFTHTEIAEFEQGTIALPILEKRFDEETPCVEVILLNPAPMKATYLEGNTETILIGGEIKDEVMIHDVSGFCHLLQNTDD